MTIDTASLRALANDHANRLSADSTIEWRLKCSPGRVIELLDEVEAMVAVVRMSERVASRGIHRRDDHRHVVDRRVELLPNDIEILGKLADAITTLRTRGGGEG